MERAINRVMGSAFHRRDTLITQPEIAASDSACLIRFRQTVTLKIGDVVDAAR